VKRRPDDEGPEELHVIVLDNGRSRMLRERVTRQSLACIRCGACLNACPVYQQIGGHAYGSVYPGPIGAVITPQLSGLAKAGTLPFASTLCGACRDVCPVKIDIPALLLALRAKVAGGATLPHSGDRPRRGIAGGLERAFFRVWAWVLADARRYGVATALLRRVPLSLLPGASRWRRTREMRPLAARPFRKLFEDGRAGTPSDPTEPLRHG
jgi:L-lactate dehydrogenase complex protein LldF